MLPGTTALPEELADEERVVAYWGGRPEVRRRVEALQQSSASIVLFLNARGLLHFDALFQNILTDGRRLYFTDFGLTL
ncbi:hypothetical protein C1703_20350 [Streptomyces sp. Go-475]|nr:hypothetical protein C1703_20350 [Streptomyces sp. Go-475]